MQEFFFGRHVTLYKYSNVVITGISMRRANILKLVEPLNLLVKLWAAVTSKSSDKSVQ